MLIVWDEPKRLQNLQPEPDGHGLDFADARDRFAWDDAFIAPTHAGEDGRPRFLAIGRQDGRLMALVFAPLGSQAIAIISLRHASRKERKAYAQQL